MSEIRRTDAELAGQFVTPESPEMNNQGLKQQYIELAKLSKAVRGYISEHPESESKVVLETFLNDELLGCLTNEQIEAARHSIADFVDKQRTTYRLCEGWDQDPRKSLESIFENYIKAGVLNFSDVEAKFIMHNGMMTVIIDRQHYDAICQNVEHYTDEHPDGFLFNAQKDQAMPAYVKMLVGQFGILPADTRDSKMKTFLDHEAAHYANRFRISEYGRERKGKKVREDVIMLKEEIISGFVDGSDTFGLAVRLYDDMYNQYNASIKRDRERLLGVRKGDLETAGVFQMLIEENQVKRKYYRDKLTTMLARAQEIVKDNTDIGIDLLAVTPVHHWKLFAERPAPIEHLEIIGDLFNSMDSATDDYDPATARKAVTNDPSRLEYWR